MNIIVSRHNKASYLLFFLLTFTSGCCLVLDAQNNKQVDEEFPTPVAFPYEYLGTYSGNLNVADPTGSIANVPTDFIIKKTNDKEVFEYEFSFYQGENKIVNKYLLHIIDEEKGYYAITDEEGLEFMATLIKCVLYSTYDTKDKIMITSLQFTNDGKLRFNIIITLKSKKQGKGGTNLSNVVQVQKALLSKT